MLWMLSYPVASARRDLGSMQDCWWLLVHFLGKLLHALLLCALSKWYNCCCRRHWCVTVCVEEDEMGVVWWSPCNMQQWEQSWHVTCRKERGGGEGEKCKNGMEKDNTDTGTWMQLWAHKKALNTASMFMIMDLKLWPCSLSSHQPPSHLVIQC